MANQTVYITNPTRTAFSNVNAAGDDVPAESMWKDTIVLSDAEQAALAAAAPKVVLVGSTLTADGRGLGAKLLHPFSVVQGA